MRPRDEFSQPNGLPPGLVDRLLSGEATEADYEHFAVWADAHEDERILARFLAAVSARKTIAPSVDLDRGWMKIMEQMRVGSSSVQGRGKPSEHGRISKLGEPASRVNARSRWVGVGTQTLPKGVGLGRQTLRGKGHTIQWIVGMATVVLCATFPSLFLRRTIPSAVLQHYRTGNAQRATVRLADGSHLLLAPATSVDVRSTGLDVTGEVYVAIVPHSARPMTVRTANAVVRVLGTSFVVRHYAGESTTRVVVEDGRVVVQPRTQSATAYRHARIPTVLSANMLAQVADSGVTVLSSISTREYVEWTRGTLVFNHVALGSVIAELARAYGAEIHVSDTTLAKHLMRMDVTVADDPLAQVLDEVCYVTNAHYTRTGNVYVLSPGRSNTQLQRSAPLRRLLPQPEHSYGR